MSLKAYIDDSGVGDSSIYVLAGWIASVETWLKFNDAWVEVLRMRPSIPYFKTQDAVNLKGAFLGISEPSRDEKIRLLMRTIESFDILGISASVSQSLFDHYFQQIKPERYQLDDGNRTLKNPWKSPYFFLSWTIMFRALPELYKNGIKDKIDFIFDDQVIERDNIELLARGVQKWKTENPNDEISKMIGNMPYFLNDIDVIPLQAADLHAGFTRRVQQAGDAGYLAGPQLPGSPGATIRQLNFRWTRELMDQFVSGALGYVPDGPIRYKWLTTWHFSF